MENKILVIDDEKAIVDIIKFNLEKEGYKVETAHDGEEGIKAVNKYMPELVILDVMMPKKDGFQVLKEIRTNCNIPVIMLTAKEEEVDKVLGLELGADDYITKPFSMRELVARVKANLRRVDFSSTSNLDDSATMIASNGLTLDLNKYEKLKYIGYDKENNALRYTRCNTGKKVYRVPLSTDYRIFVPIARDSKKFKRLYKKRTEVERLNGRIDRDYMFNDHFIRGQKKMDMMLFN